MAPSKKIRNTAKTKTSSKDLDAFLAEVSRREDAKRAEYRAAASTWNALPSTERAQSWLRYFAENRQCFGDLEAVVYLARTQQLEPGFVAQIDKDWRAAEQITIDRYRRETRQNGPVDVSAANAFALRDFWTYSDHQEHTIDATMLRCMEACRLSGFEQWWQRMDRSLREAAFSGGIHWFTLLSLCRSTFALREMRDALSLNLQSKLASHIFPEPPWWDVHGHFGCHLIQASALAFASVRLGGTRTFVEAAVKDLRLHFNSEIGAWPTVSAHPEQLGVGATALALHALKLSDAEDFEFYGKLATAWLRSKQHADGYWIEAGAPDAVWLSVLVLDALALAANGDGITLNIEKNVTAPTVFVAYQHDDREYVTLLTKHLGALIHSGRIEFFDDNQIGGGSDWDDVIRQKLYAAKIIVPLVSPNFLGSKYVQTVELPTAMRRRSQGKVHVLPVLLDDCDWQAITFDGDDLSEISFLPKTEKNELIAMSQWGRKRNAAMTQVAKRIRELVS